MICRICGNQNENMPVTVREMMYGTGEEFVYFECAVCGCLQIRDFPEDMESYYPDHYYSFAALDSRNPIVNMLVKWRDRYAVWGKSLLGRILYHLRENPKLNSLSPLKLEKAARILDVGCGRGSLLLALRNLGFENLLGVDPFVREPIDDDKGIKIIKGTLGDVNGEWDVIMFHHSFEHLPDPAETLRLAAARLADGGYCLIRIPTVSSYAWKHYREHWVELDAPRHFFLHSVESMKRLASQTGLDLFHKYYDSTAFQFWGSEQYVRGIPLRDEHSYAVNPGKSIFTRKDIRHFEKKSRALNRARQGSSACFYLRKKKKSDISQH